MGQVTAVQTTSGALSGVRLADGRTVAREAVAIATRLEGRDDLLADLGLELAELSMAGTVLGRHLPSAPGGATSTAGVWAAGNLTSPMAQVIGAASDGATAGSAIHLDLIHEDVAVAVAAHRERPVPQARGEQVAATTGVLA